MLSEHIVIPNKLWTGIYQTGSSVICDPPVLDTDIDYIICTPSFSAFDKFVVDAGFRYTSNDEEGYVLQNNGFFCYRRDNLNLIVTESNDWYLKWVAATKLAKKLNLLQKKDRIILFQYILYGVI
uniref:Nucleotidyltransferase n=1 Tax=viral metagenome TaxID=1070528 RepID=A0A6C0JWT4_9ZZZZ